MLLIKNAKVFTMENEVLENSGVLLWEGKIWILEKNI